MSRFAPKSPGDNFYPRYQRADLYTAGNISFKKGDLLTIAATGKLARVTKSGDYGVFSAGAILQATVNSDASRTAPGAGTVAVADNTRVPCFAPGSRIGLVAGEALTRGQLVRWNDDDGRVEGLPVIPAARGTDAERTAAIAAIEARETQCIGRVFDFYGGIPDADVVADKLLAKAKDTVIVELGMR